VSIDCVQIETPKHRTSNIVTSTHQHIDTSTHRHIDTSTHRHIDTSTHQHIDTSTHRHIDTSTHRHIKVRVQPTCSSMFVPPHFRRVLVGVEGIGMQPFGVTVKIQMRDWPQMPRASTCKAITSTKEALVLIVLAIVVTHQPKLNTQARIHSTFKVIRACIAGPGSYTSRVPPTWIIKTSRTQHAVIFGEAVVQIDLPVLRRHRQHLAIR
jgi:hypothetical protein